MSVHSAVGSRTRTAESWDQNYHYSSSICTFILLQGKQECTLILLLYAVLGLDMPVRFHMSVTSARIQSLKKSLLSEGSNWLQLSLLSSIVLLSAALTVQLPFASAHVHSHVMCLLTCMHRFAAQRECQSQLCAHRYIALMLAPSQHNCRSRPHAMHCFTLNAAELVSLKAQVRDLLAEQAMKSSSDGRHQRGERPGNIEV